jgi:nitrous oxidase accessory protein
MCRMRVAEARFATELVTPHGKVLVFDSIECLVRYMSAAPDGAAAAGQAWVTDHEAPATLLAASAAFYAASDEIRSPMGLGVAAFATAAARDAMAARLLGQALDWQAVQRTIATNWSGVAAGERDEEGAPAAAFHGLPIVAAGRSSLRRTPSSGRRVGPHGAATLTEAIRLAAPGDRLVVPPGIYREPTLIIDKPLELVGADGATLDGDGARELIEIRADDVTIRGLRLQNTGMSQVDDRAAIRVGRVQRCRIERNTLADTFFGIYLARAEACEIRGNVLRASGERETMSGNGIHLWYSNNTIVEDNVIEGHRDGIYFEFVKGSRVARNVSRGNLRYGLHFMFSDDCEYEGNRFEANGAGVAVMYTRRMVMTGNTFVDNWGSASFGLLLKDIRDSQIASNVFRRNSVGLYVEASDRLIVDDNDFDRNGWAIKLFANSEANRFAGNNFTGNSFDVATNSRRSHSTFERNYWDSYRGHDLDRDGIGEAPFRPVRLFSLLVEQNEPSLILMRSFLVQLLDAAEAVMPALTPDTLVDAAPLMRPAARGTR